VLLVTGPFKVNGVPLRRINARYVIATSTTVDLKGVDEKVLEKVSEDGYFTKDKKSKKTGEEAFFKQGEKPEVSCQPFSRGNVWTLVTDLVRQKKEIASSRVEDQKSVDKALLVNIKKEPMLLPYLSSSFSLRKADRPHMMVF
jgi:large subunit ribosomal protein L6e